MAKSTQFSRMRRLLAIESARIMAEEAVTDFRAAKEKAARHLGIDAQQYWPSNVEIQEELQARLSLFHGDTQPGELRQLRETALEAMDWLADFHPRLVGPVLEGHATRHSAVVLHLFADAPESVLFFLVDSGIAYDEGWQRLHFGEEPAADYPVFSLTFENVPLRLVIFGLDDERRSPSSPVDGRPLRRAASAQLRKLLETPRSF